jgi:molybdenum cofactor cytidylyltransferase
MRQVKPLVTVGGKPLLDHVLATARKAGLTDIVVVLGAAADQIRAAVVLNDCKVILNDSFEQGIGTSVSQGLANVSCDSQAAVMLLADAPLVLTSTLVALQSAYAKSRPPAVILTYQGQRGNPVLLDRQLFPQAMQLTGDEGFRSILRNVPDVLQLEVDDPGIVLDIDTTDDLRRCEELYRLRNQER